MIVLTRLNGDQFVLNAEIIRTVESTPDTTIKLTSGESLMVRESMGDVIDKVVDYKRLLYTLIPAA